MACAEFPNGSDKYWRKHRFRILFATDLNLAICMSISAALWHILSIGWCYHRVALPKSYKEN